MRQRYVPPQPEPQQLQFSFMYSVYVTIPEVNYQPHEFIVPLDLLEDFDREIGKLRAIK